MSENRVPRATCPVCRMVVGIFRWQGQVIYDCHGPDLHDVGGCEAGGWLVEDDEVIVPPRPVGSPERHGPGRQPINHGTIGGNDTHRRRGEKPCEACAEALRRYQRERYAARMAARGKAAR